MQVKVDPERCVGSGLCVQSVNEVFDQREEDGVVRLVDGRPPSALDERVRRAAMVCPARAITVVDETES